MVWWLFGGGGGQPWVANHWWPTTGGQPLVASHWWPTTGGQPLVASHWWPTTCGQIYKKTPENCKDQIPNEQSSIFHIFENLFLVIKNNHFARIAVLWCARSRKPRPMRLKNNARPTMVWQQPMVWPPPVVSHAVNGLATTGGPAATSGRQPPVVGHHHWSAATKGQQPPVAI